jgi:ferritin-like metal-binding protein YciE
MAANSRSRSRRSRRESPDATELLVLELQGIHNAETQLSRVLPRLAKAAQSQKLQQMLEQRQEEGERILQQIDPVFDELDASPGRRKNVAAEGLINDVREHVQEIEEGPALDAVLIAGIQKTEHYCIAAWGTARSLAEAVQQQTAVKAMERALNEGKNVDQQLTQLAEDEITPALLSGEPGEEGEESEDQEQAQGGGARKGKDSGAERRTST